MINNIRYIFTYTGDQLLSGIIHIKLILYSCHNLLEMNKNTGTKKHAYFHL